MPVEKVRSEKRGLDRLEDIALSSWLIQEHAVVHTVAVEKAMGLAEMLGESFAKERNVIAEAGPVLGAHVGPGAVGIAWVGTGD